MPKITPFEAREILASCGVKPGDDYFSLRDDVVTSLLRYAVAVRYRAPAASGKSLPRAFHDSLKKKAAKA